jgi:hypothetical protein
MHRRTSPLLRPVTSASPSTVGSSRISRQPRTIRAAGERTAHAGMPPTRPIRSDPIMKADFSCFFSASPPSSLGAMPPLAGSQSRGPGRMLLHFPCRSAQQIQCRPLSQKSLLLSSYYRGRFTLHPCRGARWPRTAASARREGRVCARRLVVSRPDAWRRGRDSNPRYGITVHTLSRRAPSTARSPLLPPAAAWSHVSRTCRDGQRRPTSPQQRVKHGHSGRLPRRSPHPAPPGCPFAVRRSVPGICLGAPQGLCVETRCVKRYFLRKELTRHANLWSTCLCRRKGRLGIPSFGWVAIFHDNL